MTEHTEPFQWVSARAKCRLDLVFSALFDVVQRDISEAEDVLADRKP